MTTRFICLSFYDGVRFTAAYRVDFIVENCLIVELKCVEKMLPVHRAQL